MTDRARKYLVDIQIAIDEMDQFLAGPVNFQHYQNNLLIKRAVERELTIIGEAVNRLLALEPDISISSARQIVRFRNRITHEYDAVDDVNVWAILKNHLPLLRQEIQDLLDK